MKSNKHVGILTFPHSPSFGASLQMTALYSILIQYGYDVDIINYINRYMKNDEHISNNNKKTIKQKILKCLSLPSVLRFKKFENNLTYFPAKMITDCRKLVEVERHFDKLVCGSDQVWNPGITGNDMSYFLNFCDGCKRVAYAPSFGVTELEEPIRSQIANEINLFTGLSVREKQGQELVYAITGKTCEVVIDPTMLLDSDFWETKITKPSSLKDEQPYIANFIFHPNDTTRGFVESLKKQSGAIERRYSWSVKELLKDHSCVGQFGPREWLWYIKNADYVVTDSFHGCVFSILFRKKFFVSMNASANSRLKNLLFEFGLEDRVIKRGAPLDLSKEINYEEVELIRKRRAQESLSYLIDSLEKEA